MNSQDFLVFWAIVGPIAAVVLTIGGQYLLDKRKEYQAKRDDLKVLECIELANQIRIINNDIFGPMANDVQVKVPEAGPKSQLVEIHDLYYAKYRLRNLSASAMSNILVKLENGPKAIWFTINQGNGHVNPDWEAKLKKLLKEKAGPDDIGWEAYPIPYINPYATTFHEVVLEIASFYPLSKVVVTGGTEGVKFIFKKTVERKPKKWFIFLSKTNMI